VLASDYFSKGYYPLGRPTPARGFTAMGALLKAILVNSGEQMMGPEATKRGGSAFPNIDQVRTEEVEEVEVEVEEEERDREGCILLCR